MSERPARSSPGGSPRPPTVAEAFDPDRRGAGAVAKVPLSPRYGSGARSPLPLLGLLLVCVGSTWWVLVAWQPDHIGHRAGIEVPASGDDPGAVLAARAATASAGFGAAGEVPSIAPGSQLTCWRSYEPVVARADAHLAAEGVAAATFADLGLPDDASAAAGLSQQVISQAPTAQVGCGHRAAALLLEEAQRIGGQYEAWRFTVYALAFVCWLAAVAWLSRVITNLRPSVGRSVGIGTAVASLTPLWIVPLVAFRFLGLQTDDLWLQRAALVLAVPVAAAYVLWTLARVASQVWEGTGLARPGLSAMLWAPALASVTWVLAGLVAYSIAQDQPIPDDLAWADVVPAAFPPVLVVGVGATIAGWAIYLVTISIAQHVGIARAVDGSEAQPGTR